MSNIYHSEIFRKIVHSSNIISTMVIGRPQIINVLKVINVLIYKLVVRITFSIIIT